jgi:hypothetical protein
MGFRSRRGSRRLRLRRLLLSSFSPPPEITEAKRHQRNQKVARTPQEQAAQQSVGARSQQKDEVAFQARLDAYEKCITGTTLKGSD